MIPVILIPTQVLLSLHSPGTILVTAPIKCDVSAPVPVAFVGTRESSLNVRKGVFASVIV